ncbi:GGDEF domain-containing protein [Hasllibacter sp. MH4015]|uniref:GGDEF domain-containing protein n=1 Tax=Hasllibacter sp. MH4015 TaxID=2854029 RepID=UPI001CD4730D|nr:GGDEF domain-containing protein [Hasllibacter sp. MH4015]
MSIQGAMPRIDGALPAAIMDRLMPMHLSLGPDGTILHAAPTIAKMLGLDNPVGDCVFDRMEFRRPRGIADMENLLSHAGCRLSLALQSAPDIPLRGVAFAVPDPDTGGQGGIMDVSLGLSFARAVADFSLTLSDFSPCDQTVELLYLHEANASTARLSRHLSERLRAAHDAAERQARTDMLTSLANRRAMDDQITRALEDLHQDFTLLHLDLDLFKTVNDTLGHAAGDAVLMEVGRILSRELRRTDFPARVGGDEFVVLLRPAVPPFVAARIAQRLIDRIEVPIPFEGETCRISASIGIVASTQYTDRPSLEQIMSDVDTALYRAKNEGRGRFVMFNRKSGR